MSASRQIAKSVRSYQNKPPLVFPTQITDTYVRAGQNGTYANDDEDLVGGGRKNVFTRAHLPPATKKALRSVGMEGVHTGAVVGSEGLGMLEDSSKIIRKHGAKIIATKALSAMAGSGRPLTKKDIKKAKHLLNTAVGEVPDEVKQELKQKAKARGKKVLSQLEDKLVGGSKRPPSKWVMFVKQYAKDHDVSYKEAMSLAKDSYHKNK